MSRSRAVFLSLVALAFAGGCSSDDGGAARTPGSEQPGDPLAAPGAGNGQAGAAATSPVDLPAATGDVGMGAGTDNSETINPVGGLDPNAGASDPSAGSGAPPAEPVEEDPPADEEDPVVPPPPVEVFAEDSGLDCVVPELPNAINALPTLPNPFQKLDGTTVASRADWRCRRKELRALAERHVYGTKPSRPESVTGSITNQQITVNVTNQGNTATFSAGITLPTTGTAPFPAVFSVAGSDQNTFLSQGVAIINFNPNSVGQEQAGGGSQANRQNKSGAFYSIYGNNSPTGLLAAWAWGVSRYIDVIEESDGSLLDVNALAVMGCSRSGKAALAIGALDERIALSVPFESGTAGVPLFRAVAQAEVGDNGQPSQSLPNAFGEQAWFGDAFSPFLGSAQTIPIDTHEILGMFAPRGLLILDNPFIGELTPRGAHAAALAGVEVYKALGVEENLSYLSATGSGTHCAIRTEYQEPLRQAIQKHLFKNEAAAGGTIETSQTFATANPEDWITWETPTLQ